ncbi:MAG: GMC family oxidoreductase N-terminal domain-containing protein [Candidatus Nanopelagicales bacterium]
MTSFDVDVAVVGSGFGGGVAALRHAEAGRRVAVLEQGRRLTRADLEAGARSTRSLLWAPEAGLSGYFRQSVLRHVVVVHGVGVGGGSIVYAAVLLRPGAEAWRMRGWTGTGLDWAAELDPHYATAASMLGVETNPYVGAQDRWLGEAAAALGAGATYGPTPQGISFADCVRCGACLTGCVHGAKNSVDRTYLARAEALGATVTPRSQVRSIARLRGGGWRLEVVDPLDRRSPVRTLDAREVVLAGGVLGTTGLLLASRDRWRTLPYVAPALGRHVRTNSEAFTAVLQPEGSPDVSTDGATISSDFHPDGSTHVTNNRFPASYGFMRWYLAPLVDAESRSARARGTLAALVRDPRTATANIGARDWNRRVTVLTVMQHDDNEIALELRRGPLGWGLRSRRAPGAAPIPTYLPQANAAARAVAAASGGTAYGTLLDPVLGIGATAHILGGAVIATSPEQGVVDLEHRVFASDDGDVHEDLRVLDGSVVPANIGVNPSLTITALAERAMALR